jgi:hypothetical protein
MTELSGRERVGQVIDGMKRENAALQDPNVRAERFVERWQELQGQRRQLRGWQHDEARGKVESQMNGLPRALNATRRLNPSCAIAGRNLESVRSFAASRPLPARCKTK